MPVLDHTGVTMQHHHPLRATALSGMLRYQPFRERIPELLCFHQALYVAADVLPPWPVQFVWKNSPRGLSRRS